VSKPHRTAVQQEGADIAGFFTRIPVGTGMFHLRMPSSCSPLKSRRRLPHISRTGRHSRTCVHQSGDEPSTVKVMASLERKRARRQASALRSLFLCCRRRRPSRADHGQNAGVRAVVTPPKDSDDGQPRLCWRSAEISPKRFPISPQLSGRHASSGARGSPPWERAHVAGNLLSLLVQEDLVGMSWIR